MSLGSTWQSLLEASSTQHNDAGADSARTSLSLAAFEPSTQTLAFAAGVAGLLLFSRLRVAEEGMRLVTAGVEDLFGATGRTASTLAEQQAVPDVLLSQAAGDQLGASSRVVGRGSGADSLSGVSDRSLSIQQQLARIDAQDKAMEARLATKDGSLLNPDIRAALEKSDKPVYSLPEALAHLRGEDWRDGFFGQIDTGKYTASNLSKLISSGKIAAYGVQGEQGPELRLFANHVAARVFNDAENFASSASNPMQRLRDMRSYMSSHGYAKGNFFGAPPDGNFRVL